MPKLGPDKLKLEKIIKTLKKHPEGLCVRELARKSGVDKSAVSRYASLFMKDELEIRKISNLVKLIKLKTG